MQLDTIALGTVTYEEQDVITFPQGIPGFEGYHRFLIINIDEESSLGCLQSLDDSRVHFIIINPFTVYLNYEFKIEAADQSELGIQSEADVEVWSIVTGNEHIQEATMNLMAPIIINKQNRNAKQIILHNSAYRTKHAIHDLMAAVQDEGE